MNSSGRSPVPGGPLGIGTIRPNHGNNLVTPGAITSGLGAGAGVLGFGGVTITSGSTVGIGGANASELGELCDANAPAIASRIPAMYVRSWNQDCHGLPVTVTSGVSAIYLRFARIFAMYALAAALPFTSRFKVRVRFFRERPEEVAARVLRFLLVAERERFERRRDVIARATPIPARMIVCAAGVCWFQPCCPI